MALPVFPEGKRLGRMLASIPMHSLPTPDSSVIRTIFEDEVVPLHREVVGSQPYRINQNWLESPEGFIWSPDVQRVHNLPNSPIRELPETSLGTGMWAEVTVPYVDLTLVNPPARAPWLANRLATGLNARFFYKQVAWIEAIEFDEQDEVFYQVKERFGYGDAFLADARAFRPLTPEEIEPINPDIEDKKIVVDITRQTLTAYEEGREAYFARVSTGVMTDFQGNRVDEWGTPLGTHRIWRKAVSLPLSGGSSAAGWDLPAVGWITLFVGKGVAVHSTHWHHNYGVPTSRGCVNCQPEDAKWVFRWTAPQIGYDPGDITVGMPGGTQIQVIQS